MDNTKLVKVLLISALAVHCLNGEYLGCFEDSGNRLLPDYRMELGDINSPSKCIYICKQLDFRYAGVENGNQCFCSYQKPSDIKKRNENECESSCPYSTEKCGGSWRLSVYSVESYLPSNTVYEENGTYIGCFDDLGKPILSDFRIDLSEINTPSKCIHICREHSFQYSGVENGNECFCGNKRPPETKKRSENDCRNSCPHSNEHCGGSWRLAVYLVNPSSVPIIADESVNRTILGCFEDSGNRLLSDYRINLNDINSPKRCLHICQQLGFTYSGVEYGNECFCGNQRPSEDKKKSEKDCRSSCPNNTEKCGGSWRISVYTTELLPPITGANFNQS